MMENSLQKTALFYRTRMNWSIIPIKPRGKRAIVPWKQFQSTPPSTEQVQQWWKDHPKANIAVVLGSSSGNLLCRDFDLMKGYRAWEQQFPELACILPTVQTGRGARHVYFTGIGFKGTKVFSDGELRRDGAYAVLPPSIHETGVQYEWLIEPTGNIPEANPKNFARTFSQGQTQCVTERVERTERIDEVLKEGEVDEAIGMTLPTGHGQRHKKIFEFARTLKSIPEYGDVQAKDLWEEFQRWFTLAEPFIKTKDRMKSWDEFCDAWERIVIPLGENPMDMILEKAQQHPPLEVLEKYNDTKLNILANVCMELGSEGRVFFLSARTAGGLLEDDHMTAWRRLRILERDGVITAVKRGKQGGKKATRYRFVD